MAHDYLAALERPHLDGAELAVTGMPKVAPLLRVGSQSCREVGLALFGSVGVQAPHPCRLALVTARNTAQQLGNVQVMQLPDEFAVPGTGVVHRADKQLVDVHVLDAHVFALAGLVPVLHTLDAAARNQEFLKRAAVEFVEFVRTLDLGQWRRFIVFVFDVLAAETADNRLDQLPDHVVGNALAALAGQQFALGHHASLVVAHQVAPLVTVGKPLVPQPCLPQSRPVHPCPVGRMQHFQVFFIVRVFHDNKLMSCYSCATRSSGPRRKITPTKKACTMSISTSP